jgi:DNA-binding beta-propeller fold protein YncE
LERKEMEMGSLLAHLIVASIIKDI